MTPTFDRGVSVDDLLEQVQKRFNLGSTFGTP